MNTPDYDKIIKNLYLGNLESTKDYKFLYLNNIKYILSLTQNEVRLEPNKYKHIHFHVKDAPYQDLISLFDICNSFINEGLNNNLGVLVHCDMGISRSATIIISYLMKKKGKNFMMYIIM
jgi:protein-tyrosine phosphatase